MSIRINHEIRNQKNLEGEQIRSETMTLCKMYPQYGKRGHYSSQTEKKIDREMDGNAQWKRTHVTSAYLPALTAVLSFPCLLDVTSKPICDSIIVKKCSCMGTLPTSLLKD